MNAGTGVFTQTGGSVGSFGIGGDEQGHWSDGGRQLGRHGTLGNRDNLLQPRDLHPRQANGTGSPLFVGGLRGIGVSGTGSFTQNCGTNAIVGGGDYDGHPGNATRPL